MAKRSETVESADELVPVTSSTALTRPARSTRTSATLLAELGKSKRTRVPESEAFDRLVQEIRQCHAACLDAIHSSLIAGCQAGHRLLALKELVPHGEFLAVVESIFPNGEKKAQRYMTLARNEPRLLEALRSETQAAGSSMSDQQLLHTTSINRALRLLSRTPPVDPTKAEKSASPKAAWSDCRTPSLVWKKLQTVVRAFDCLFSAVEEEDDFPARRRLCTLAADESICGAVFSNIINRRDNAEHAAYLSRLLQSKTVTGVCVLTPMTSELSSNAPLVEGTRVIFREPLTVPVTVNSVIEHRLLPVPAMLIVLGFDDLLPALASSFADVADTYVRVRVAR